MASVQAAFRAGYFSRVQVVLLREKVSKLMSLLTFNPFQVHHFPSMPQFTNLLSSVILASRSKVLIMTSNQELRATKAENRSLFFSLQFLHIKNPQQHYHQNSAKKGLCDTEQGWTWISHAALLFIT